MTWQVAAPGAPTADRLQLVAGVKLPVPSLVKLTDPVGVVFDAEVSVTTAVQSVPVLTVTELGTHETPVVVGAAAAGGVTVSAKVPWLAA